MASIIEQTRSSSRKPIPVGAEIIQINDDIEEKDEMDRQYYDWLQKEYIDEAILSKNLDSVKKAIFTFLNRTKFKTDKNQAEKTIRANYVEYFKLKMDLDISRAFYRSPLQVPDPNSEPDKNHIIVHGVDFLSNAQLDNKFKGIHPVIIQRINASNASIKFNSNENVQNVLSLLRDSKKDPDLSQIQQEGWHKWKQLKKYDVLGFERPLKYRLAAENQTFSQKEDYNLKNFQINKASIQESDLFITCKQDKDFYDLKMQEFEESLLTRRPRYSRSRRSENGQSQRSRTRDRKYGGRNENYDAGDYKIDDFDRKFNRNDRNDRGGRGNFTDREKITDRNRGYNTQRGNFDRRNGDFRRDQYRGNFGDRQNQDRSNFRRNNDRDWNHERENRFFNKDDRKNNSIIEEEKDISYSIPKKSISKSRSNSSRSRSYKVNESMQAPFNPKNVSMSFILPDKTEAVINQDVTQSFFLNQTHNNSMNPIQDVTESFIFPLANNHKEEQNDSKSQEDLEEILKKIDEEKQEMQKPRKRSRSNSSIGSRSITSRKNSNDRNKRSGSVRGSNKGSQRQPNNRDNQRNERGNGDFGGKNNYNNRNNNYINNRYSNNDSGFNNQSGGRANNFRQNPDNGNTFQRRNYENRDDRRDFNNQNRERDFQQRKNNYNGGNRFNNNQENRDGQIRNYNNNNRYDRLENNNNKYDRQEPRKDFDSAFDQYKKKEKLKVTENLLQEDDIDY